MLSLLISVTAWMLFTLATSKVEAALWHYRNVSEPPRPRLREHQWLTVIRAVVLAGIYAYVGHWMIPLGLAAIFPFFHDGWYYQFRNKIDSTIYPKGFIDEPDDDSTAIFDFQWEHRLALCIAGVFTILTYILIYIL